MCDRAGNPEDRFSHNEAHSIAANRTDLAGGLHLGHCGSSIVSCHKNCLLLFLVLEDIWSLVCLIYRKATKKKGKRDKKEDKTSVKHVCAASR